METLETITNPESDAFKKVWEIYEEAFPADERRSLEAQKALFEKWRYRFQAINLEGQVIGLIADWTLEGGRERGYHFIEHYAIRKDLRGKGHGSRVLREYIHESNRRIILETERPTTNDQKRRIKFWENGGLNLNEYDYIQPAYSKEKKPVPMFLMTWIDELNPKQFEDIRRDIHHYVYCLERPLTSL